MNFSDSERIATVLGKMGYKPTKKMASADLIILNSCSVKKKAEERIYGLGELFLPLKEKNPRLKIGITGCMIRKSTGLRDKKGEAIFRRMDPIDFTFKIKDLMKLPEMLRELHQAEGAEDVKDLCDYFHIPQTITNISQVFIPIMIGCNNFCAYCIVPYARGKEESRTIAEVLEEVEKVAKRGAKEINLVGQNVDTYLPADADIESKEVPFAQLLRKIDALPGVDRIRFYTVHPKDMSEDVIKLYGQLRTMTPHLHLPVQSGSNSVLKRMNRAYTVERFKELVAKMRARIPHMSISTDIIVGFCGETEEEFMESCNLIKDLKIDLVYVSKYSEREGTLAARELKDDVPLEAKKDRFRRITDVMKQVSHEYNQQFLGKTVQVLVEKIERGYAFGKIPEYKLVRFKPADKKLIGQYVDIKIEKAMEWCLEGKMI